MALFRFGAVLGLMEVPPVSSLPWFQTGASDVFKAQSDWEVLRLEGWTSEALDLG